MFDPTVTEMRILILADDCNPGWPSLPAVAYKAIYAIAKYADVVVATHVRNRENIEKVGFGRAKVRYFDNEYIARPMRRLSNRGGTAVALAYPSNLAFEWAVWRAMRDELREGDFDIVHRISPMSPTLPSPIAIWSPVPFVLGPLNGGLKWPSAFREELARERAWLSYARNAHRWFPYYDSSYRKPKAVLAAFSHTIEDLPKHARSRAINFPEIGIDPSIFRRPASRMSRRRKNILLAGRLVPYKLPKLAIQIFVDRPALRKHQLLIVGDGPERPALEQLVQRHGLHEQVTFLGWKSQREVGAIMRDADIFLFPSIRELGAGVLAEAMACSLACIVVDYGGPGKLIASDRGIKVPLADKKQLTQSFADALERLVIDDDRIHRLGEAARKHVTSFYSWDAKAKKL